MKKMTYYCTLKVLVQTRLHQAAGNWTYKRLIRILNREPRNTKLHDNERDKLDGEISLKECKNAIRTFAKGNSPGDDGLTWEFFNSLSDFLGRDLVECFNASFRESEMLISQKRGVITLIPKEDSDLTDLYNWRPITLLNTDYKIASKVL